MTEARWDCTIDVNLKGVFLTLQAAANQMIQPGNGGRLIAIASITAEWGAAGTPAYCASPAASGRTDWALRRSPARSSLPACR